MDALSDEQIAALGYKPSPNGGWLPLVEEEPRQIGPAPQLADLLDAADRFISRFVMFGNRHQRVAVALWIAHVFAIEAAPAAAYLRIKSAAEESGKTTLLEVIELLLGGRAINAVSVTPAVVFRFRDKLGAVALLLDEVDNTIRARQDDGARDLLALVNAGYRRSAIVYRTVGKDHEPRAFRAFGPAAIAGIGHLHPTTESRCIPIVLDRKPRGHGERWLRHLVEYEGQNIREEFEAWANEDDTMERLKSAHPEIPDGLRDRHVETWWTLWNIADRAGGEWPRLAREAALALHLGADQEDTMSTAVLLLAHVRAAFDADGADRLSTVQLLHRLVDAEEGPWGKWWDPDSQGAKADLARHLRPFGVRPRVIKMADGSTPRGYRREDFEKTWGAYLLDPPATTATPATPLASTVAEVAEVAPPQARERREPWIEVARALFDKAEGNCWAVARELRETGHAQEDGARIVAADVARALGVAI